MKNKLTFIGHASLKIVSETGVVIYIDPAFTGGDYSEKADIILITHHHGDHDKLGLVTETSGCVVLDNTDMLKNGVYQEKTVKGVSIKAVPAYNTNHKPDRSVGYILFLGDVSLYVSGDTSKTKEMSELRNLNLDYVIMPIDGVYNMGPQEAEECVELIKPRVFIPVHNDPRSMNDGKEYDTGFDKLQDNKVLILHHGETIEL